MSDKKINLKSDVPAKLAFIQNLLLVQGFDEAKNQLDNQLILRHVKAIKSSILR